MPWSYQLPPTVPALRHVRPGHGRGTWPTDPRVPHSGTPKSTFGHPALDYLEPSEPFRVPEWPTRGAGAVDTECWEWPTRGWSGGLGVLESACHGVGSAGGGRAGGDG